jgi:hypothetical protein
MESPPTDNDKIIALYNKNLPPYAIKVDGDKGKELAEALIAFTEEDDRAIAITRVEEMLQNFAERFVSVYGMVKQFPCLENDIALAALLGFKPKSSVNCQKVDHEALELAIKSIAGLDGYFPYDRNFNAIDNLWDKINFWLTVRVAQPYYEHEFMIANTDWINNLEVADVGNFAALGRSYGYDKVNSAKFAHSLSTGFVATKKIFFQTPAVFWNGYQDGEQAAFTKLLGYEILLDLARLKWDDLMPSKRCLDK